MQEHVRVIDQDMQAGVAVRRGDNLRRAGEDLRLGGEALVEGTRVTAGVQMLASSLDQTEFAVAGQPRVTLVCTGDELRAIGLMGGIASIPESNSIGICALAHQAGALVNVAPLVVDDPRALARVLAIALDRCDLLVTIGGASVGEHDYVKAALEAADVAFDFCKVAIKPGKPVAFGRKGRGRVLALPGNPASALVTFALFGMPLLRSMQGDAQPAALRYTVPISTRMRRTSERLTLALGRTLFVGTRYEFVAHPNQSSGAVIALGNSNGMAFIGPGESPCEAETPVEFIAWSSL
jgi:molybdopterin molybdotransferase